MMANSMFNKLMGQFTPINPALVNIGRFARSLVNVLSAITMGMPVSVAEDKNVLLVRMIGGFINVVILMVGLVAWITENCPAQPLIPVYLMMVAAVNLFLKPNAIKPEWNFFEVLMKDVVTCLVSYAGYVWINRVPIVNIYDAENDYNYCPRYVFFIASWLNKISLIFSVWIVGCILIVLFAICINL